MHVEPVLGYGKQSRSSDGGPGISNAALIEEARIAIKSGNRHQARLLLQQAIRQNVEDHTAWAWLATITVSPETGLACARRAEQLMPSDPLVRKVCEWAERRWRTSEKSSEPESPQNSRQRSILRQVWHPKTVWAGIGIGLIILLGLIMVLAWNSLDPNRRLLSETADDVAPASMNDTGDQLSLAAVTTSPQPTKAQATSTPTPLRIQAKSIASSGDQGQSAGPRATWTTTPSPTNTPSPTPTYMPTFVSPNNTEPVVRPLGVTENERWIDVDLSSQTLSAYEGNGLVYSSLISSGIWQYPTVTGQFRIWVRYRSQTMDGRRLGYDYYLPNVPYVMYFYEDYALHGTYWHNNFGTPMSHGCVNMRTSDAEWIFNWSSLGTLVNVHQ